jgi:hypothetical protein
LLGAAPGAFECYDSSRRFFEEAEEVGDGEDSADGVVLDGGFGLRGRLSSRELGFGCENAKFKLSRSPWPCGASVIDCIEEYLTVI